MYTVKQLASLAGVSSRTLHYYDEIGLLKPTRLAVNGYRLYDAQALLRLQQILFYKELDFSLEQIQQFLARPDFDLRRALLAHKAALQQRVERLQGLITTVDDTLLHLEGKSTMTDQQLFVGFSEEKQAQYAEEIRQRYGDQAFEGVRDWNSYSAAEKAAIQTEGQAIYRDLVAQMEKSPSSPEVQAIILRWHQHLRYFYEPSVERLRGLAQLYNEHPEFVANFTRLHPNLPAFARQAIEYYCDCLG